MAAPFIAATLLYNHTGRIAARLGKRVDAVVTKTAFDLQAEAQDNITDVGAIDTGSMKASVYAVTPEGGDFGVRSAEARGLNPRAQLLEEATAGEHEAAVAVGVEHGIYNELGTVHMPPRPFLAPAAETVRGPFEKALAEVFKP